MANKKISELQSRTPALSDLMLVGDPSSGYSYKCTVTALATIIETDIADGYVTIGTTQTISGAKTFSNNLTLTSVANATTTQTKFLTLNASNVVNYRTGAEVLADIGGASSSSISGTTNYVAKFTSSSAIGNSTIQDSGSLVTIGSNTTINTNAPELTLNQGTNSISLINFKENNVLVNRIISSGATLYFNTNNSSTSSLILGSTGTVSFGTIPNATIDTDRFLVSDGGLLKYRTGAEVLSDIGGASAALYVPYTGATTNVNLGTRTITANGVYSTEGTYVANTYGLYGRNAANNAYNLLVGITGQDKVYIDGSGSGTIMNGTLTLSVINNATVDTDTFLVADSGVIKYRTGTQLLSDIGAASSSSISGTTNYIPKFTSSSAIGNSIMYEGTNGIGIGTTTPIGLLHIASSGNTFSIIDGGASSNTGVSFYKGGSAAGAIYYLGASDAMRFDVVNAERMRLDASGNLGLGTSSPSYKLDVNGTGRFGNVSNNTEAIVLYDVNSTKTHIGSGFGGTFIQNNNYYNGSAYVFDNNTLPSSTITLSGGGFNVQTGAANTNPSTKLTLDVSGNLGLGVTPSAWSLGKAFEVGNLGNGIWSVNATQYNILHNAYYNGGYLYATSNPASYYQQTSGQHAWYNAPSGTAGNAISFTQAMTLDASGRLGIGQTSPQYRLDVYGGARIENAGEASLTFRNNTWGNFTIGQSAYSLGGGFLSIGAASAIMTFDGTNQRVGIGTTSPTEKLDLQGTMNMNGASGTYASIQYNGTTRGYYGTANAVISGGATTDFGISATSNLIFGTGGSYTERMRITSGGNVGIGTSSVSYTLHVQKSISGNVLSMFYNDANSGTDTALITRLGSNCSNTSSYYFTGGIYGVADKIYIYGNGNIVNANNSYGAISDIRLKENISDTTSKLADLLKVKIRNYNLIGDDKKQIGVIAQELETIFPSMIEVDGKSGMKQVKYSVFVPMLIKGLQELKAELDTLKNK